MTHYYSSLLFSSNSYATLLLSLFLSYTRTLQFKEPLSFSLFLTGFLLQDRYRHAHSDDTMVIDEWMISAMADDTVVAELLVRLKHSKAASVSAKSHPKLAPPPLPKWGTKQPRSRLTTASLYDGAATAVVSRRKEEADSTRCSPTTPLSWSGGASPSPTADGYEDSSHPTVLSHPAVATATATATRSKATATSEYTGNAASTKRCKRRKTFAELVQEESSLLKERIYLRKEIANKNATFKAQRARNESLKRMKLDLGSIPRNKPNSSSDEPLCTLSDLPQLRIVPSRAHTNATEDDTHPQAADSKATRTELPDLNMMPSEDDS